MFFLFCLFEDNCCDSFTLSFWIDTYKKIVQAVILVVCRISDLHVVFLKHVKYFSQIRSHMNWTNSLFRRYDTKLNHRLTRNLLSIICKITNQKIRRGLFVYEGMIYHTSREDRTQCRISLDKCDQFSELCFVHKILGYPLNLFFLFAYVLLNIPAPISLRNTDPFGL